MMNREVVRRHCTEVKAKMLALQVKAKVKATTSGPKVVAVSEHLSMSRPLPHSSRRLITGNPHTPLTFF